MLGLDLVIGGCGDLLHGEIEVVGDKSDNEEDNEEDDQRKEFAAWGVSCRSLVGGEEGGGFHEKGHYLPQG